MHTKQNFVEIGLRRHLERKVVNLPTLQTGNFRVVLFSVKTLSISVLIGVLFERCGYLENVKS